MERERLTKKEVIEDLRLTCSEDEFPKLTAKKIGNNTFEITYPNGNKAIRYHHTDIITYLTNGDIVLNTNGYLTSTTKDRMGYLGKDGYRIIQEARIWYLQKDSIPFDWKTCKRWAYQDGMIIHPNGEIEGARVDPKELLKLNKSILKYVDGYVKALLNKEIEQPGPGDCWGCCMKEEKTGKPVFGSDHLIDHMREKYYVPSLVVNAIDAFPVSIVAKSQLGYLMGYHDHDDKWSGISIIKSQVRSSLRRYMQRRLGLAA